VHAVSIGAPRWLRRWVTGVPRLSVPAGRDMGHLVAVRQRVLAELNDVRAIQALFSGKPDLAAYARYLVNAYHYAQYSPKVMALAAARTTDSHPELSRYLLHHADEEQGHHKWALEDLSDLGVKETEARATRPVPACASMIGYVHYIAAYANPVGLFGWMYVLEAVGNDLGATAARKLTAALGPKASDRGLRFVARHGVSDADHTKDLSQQIETHVRGDDMADVCHVADVVADLYVRMFREIGGERPEWR
jgi:pyrroloquinoline quinone (PQQ) biosynthesis protein C